MATKNPHDSLGDRLDTEVLVQALVAVRNRDFTARLLIEWTGLSVEIANTFNDIIVMNERFAKEIEIASRIVGKDGKIYYSMDMGRIDSSWASKAEGGNRLIADLTTATGDMAPGIGAVPKGDLTKTVSLESEGRLIQSEFLRSTKTLNGMVDKLGSFTTEVIRVASEVGTEGKLGGQAKVAGAAVTWRDLTDNVNRLAPNLTPQMRAIADVSNGLSPSIAGEAAGEVALLKNNVNQRIGDLKLTASNNTEEDWIKSKLGHLHLQSARPARSLGGLQDDALRARLAGRRLARSRVPERSAEGRCPASVARQLRIPRTQEPRQRVQMIDSSLAIKSVRYKGATVRDTPFGTATTKT